MNFNSTGAKRLPSLSSNHAEEVEINHTLERASAMDGIFLVGSNVTVNTAIASPTGGWGGVKVGEIGTIRSINRTTREVYVDFPNHRGWKGVLNDIVPVAQASRGRLGALDGVNANATEKTDREFAKRLSIQFAEEESFAHKHAEYEQLTIDRAIALSIQDSETTVKETSAPALPLKRAPSVTLFDQRANDEAVAKDQISCIAATCLQNNEKFVDPDFPPIPKSLHGYLHVSQSNLSYGGLPTVSSWCRASAITRRRDGTSGRLHMFVGTPSAEDILQGALGDCYFVSALAVVAMREELLRKLIVGQETNHEIGAYQVRLCIDGFWTIIVVDDFLPVTEQGMLAFASGARGQMWPAIIEKAFAKVCHGYAALSSGTCLEALQILTGAPCIRVRLGIENSKEVNFSSCHQGGALGNHRKLFSIDDLWIELDSCLAAGFLVASSCGRADLGDSVEDVKARGLSTSHAYSVISVKAISLDDGKIERLIQLRNPWGRRSWNGEWSDNSAEWTPRIQHELGYYGGGNIVGIFWMSMSTFFRYFSAVDICRIRSEKSSWSEVRVSVPLLNSVVEQGFHGFKAANIPEHNNAETVTFEVEVFQGTSCEMSLYQENSRWDEGGPEMSHYANISFIVLQKMQSGYAFVAVSNRSAEASVFCEVQLDVGTYFIVPLVFHATVRNKKDMILSFYSSQPVLVNKKIVSSTILAQGMVLLARKHGEGNSFQVPGFMLYTLWDRSGAIIVAENKNNAGIATTIEVDCSESSNVTSSRGSYLTNDVVNPSESQVLQILTVVDPNAAFQFSRRTAVRSTRGMLDLFGASLMRNDELHQPNISFPSVHAPVCRK